MDNVIKLSKGLDIHLHGVAEKVIDTTFQPKTFAIKPTDFIGLFPIPKMLVEEGQEVKAGDPLFFDKPQPDVLYTAPVSGEIVEIRRGEKRAITDVVILPDKDVSFKEFSKADPKSIAREDAKKQLLQSGLWPTIRQRPYNIVAEPDAVPRDVFISCFDSSPLALDMQMVMDGNEAAFQAGCDILSRLTDGKVYLGLDAKQKHPIPAFDNAERVEKNWFKGQHPAGCVGIQIHHIKPINKGDIVWTVAPMHVVMIGRLFLHGRMDTSMLIASGGPELKQTKYYKTYIGANIESLVKDNLRDDHVRVISGNVLTGTKISQDGHLSFFDNLLTVIREGDDLLELAGWLLPSYARPSKSNTFWTGILANMGFKQSFNVTTNTYGEHRAFVVTGQYESVLPMDIYPVHLLKSILYKDFDQMEGLGIYEVVEEDMALCEFVCTSKQEVQDILREGLDYVREQN